MYAAVCNTNVDVSAMISHNYRNALKLTRWRRCGRLQPGGGGAHSVSGFDVSLSLQHGPDSEQHLRKDERPILSI